MNNNFVFTAGTAKRLPYPYSLPSPHGQVTIFSGREHMTI